MNIYDVMEMIKLGEGWMVDFKEKPPKPANFAATLVAFANHEGGTILLGVNDKGQVVGYQPTKEELDNILRSGRETCRPSINLGIEQFTIEGKNVVAVQVPQGSSIHMTTDGRCLVREGSENVGIESQKLKQLVADRNKGFLESRICDGAIFDDIDLNNVQRYLKARSSKFGAKMDIPEVDFLKSRGCVVDQHEKLTPTNAGIVLFGKNPRKFIPMDYVTVVKFQGIDHTQGYSDRKDFEGIAVDLVDQVMKWVDDRMYHGGRIPQSGAQREEVMQFHIPSTRELMTNAVAHRDYMNVGSRIIVNMFDDRLEIQSPGKLPGNVTTKNILHSQYARNPNILLTLMEWGYSEGIGQGFDRVYQDLKKGHYRKLKLLDMEGSFIVTLYAKDVEKALATQKRPRSQFELNERQGRALVFLRAHKTITLSQYLKLIPKVSSKTANRDLAEMVKGSILKTQGSTRGRRYLLADNSDI